MRQITVAAAFVATLVGAAVATPRAQAFEVSMAPVQAESFQDLLKNSDFKLELKKEGDRLVAFLGGIKGNDFFGPAEFYNASVTARVAGYSAKSGTYGAEVTPIGAEVPTTDSSRRRSRKVAACDSMTPISATSGSFRYRRASLKCRASRMSVTSASFFAPCK